MHYVCQCVRSFWTTKPLTMCYNLWSALKYSGSWTRGLLQVPSTWPTLLTEESWFCLTFTNSCLQWPLKQDIHCIASVLLGRKVSSWLPFYTSNISDWNNSSVHAENVYENWQLNSVVCPEGHRSGSLFTWVQFWIVPMTYHIFCVSTLS